jgi:CHASE3 domain sensor protein
VKKFESIPAVTKLQIRDQEVQELERKLGQLEIMIERILEESQTYIEKYQLDPEKDKMVEEMEDIRVKFQELHREVSERLQRNLKDAKTKIAQV